MAGLQSSNPVFRNTPSLRKPGAGYPTAQDVSAIYDTPQRLTMDDVVVKTAILLGVIVVTGAAAWVANVGPGLLIAAVLVGFGLAMVNIFKRTVSPALVLAYAAAEGVALGAISHAYDTQYSGLPLQAAVVTTAIFGGVLFGYTSGKLRATPQFTKIVSGAFLGLFALLVVNLLLNAFHVADLGLRSGGPIAILFSIAFIVIGSLTFVLDFDQASRMVAAGVDSREAWRISFGLVVGLVWLYLEVLRLLSYFNRR
jgi:uncharacterized YccA/Bax inhibitor family protein